MKIESFINQVQYQMKQPENSVFSIHNTPRYCSVSLAIHQSNIQGKMAEYSADLIKEKGEYKYVLMIKLIG